MVIHNDKHPLAGQKVMLNDSTNDPIREIVVPGAVLIVEDWWDRVSGQSWMSSAGNFAALNYSLRIGLGGSVPLNDEVVYGKIDGLGHLVHVSELES